MVSPKHCEKGEQFFDDLYTWLRCYVLKQGHYSSCGWSLYEVGGRREGVRGRGREREERGRVGGGREGEREGEKGEGERRKGEGGRREGGGEGGREG